MPDEIWCVFDETGRCFAAFSEKEMAFALKSYRPEQCTVVPELIENDLFFTPELPTSLGHIRFTGE